MNMNKSRWFGDKHFYRSVLTLLIPIIIQQFISSFVSLLDNVMVGSLGTEAISATSIANTVLSVLMLAIFGGLSGAGIFSAQFYGKGDMDGMRHTFRFKLYFGLSITVLAIVIYILFGEAFIASFLRGESNGGDMALALREGKDYLRIMLWGQIPFTLVQIYAGTLREAGETRAPMVAGICAICTNLFLNWVLIFGHLGAPQMGVRGAALATVISRYVELAIVAVHTHRHTDQYIFIRGAYRSGYVPGRLAGRISRTGVPLLVNEIVWSLGMTFINQFYSTRGLNAVAALNITGTAWNLFCVIMFAMGSAVSIMVGQRLGAGELQEARDTDRKLIVLTEIIHIIIGAAMVIAAPAVPRLYNVTPEVRDLTRQMLIIAGISLPLHSFAHVTYFTIRSGGRTLITFLFDAVYTWAVTVTLAFCLTHFTGMSIVEIYFCVQFIDVVKLVIGLLMLRSDFWARNVVKDI
ncbi:MAG: MATE family efflux transporter [Clostridia bacterium]|nr:MATE family efflux transporter [Clostridia bacterium]MBQ6722197.1 MATE family efflux transporter [Clostridia bacterium]